MTGRVITPEERRLEERQDAFLRDLTELTKKHSISIESCGCCGAIWLREAEPEISQYSFKRGAKGWLHSIAWGPG
jgi:hypothetical protein